MGTNAVETNRGNKKTCFNCGNEGHFVVTGDVQLMAENVENMADLGILLVVAREKKSGFKPSKPNKQHKRQQHYDRRQNFRG